MSSLVPMSEFTDYQSIQAAIDREVLTPLLNYWLSHTFEEWVPYWGA